MRAATLDRLLLARSPTRPASALRALAAWRVLFLAAASGCAAPAGSVLVVQLRTDLQTGLDFVAVEAEILAEPGAEHLRRQRLEIEPLTPVEEGLTVAEFAAVPHGSVLLRVLLQDRYRAPVTVREILVSHTGAQVVTVVVSRACAGVLCPRAGDDPTFTDCMAGRCVHARCYEEREACVLPGECVLDTDCAAPSAACARALCVTGTCLSVPDAARCGPSEYCDADLGCQPRPDDLCPPEGCDDGLLCTHDACVLGRCEATAVHDLCVEAPRGFCDLETGCRYLDPCPPEGVCDPGERLPCPSCAAGTQTCDDACQWGPCAAPAGAAEIACNGEDDDCNAATSDASCPADSACQGGSCRPLAPRLDSVSPASPTNCACHDFVAVGAHFRTGARLFLRRLEAGAPTTELTVTYGGTTRLTAPNTCVQDGAPGGAYEVWVQNADGQRSPALRVPIALSAPAITRVSPDSERSGNRYCPTFWLARGGGLCPGATWSTGNCAAGLGPAGLALTVEPGVPGVAAASSGGCLLLDASSIPPGTYCLWVTNPDGRESSRSSTFATVVP